MTYKKIMPKIIVIFHEKSRDKQIRPSIRKMKNLLSTSLKKFLRIDNPVTFRVVYGKAQAKQGKIEIFDNVITTNNIEDLIWAYEAFLDRDLWLQEEKKVL